MGKLLWRLNITFGGRQSPESSSPALSSGQSLSTRRRFLAILGSTCLRDLKFEKVCVKILRANLTTIRRAFNDRRAYGSLVSISVRRKHQCDSCFVLWFSLPPHFARPRPLRLKKRW